MTNGAWRILPEKGSNTRMSCNPIDKLQAAQFGRKLTNYSGEWHLELYLANVFARAFARKMKWLTMVTANTLVSYNPLALSHHMTTVNI